MPDPGTHAGRDPRDIVTPDAFRVDDVLLGTSLATPRRRLAALLVDLLLASVLGSLGGVFLGFAVAVVFFRVATRRTFDTPFRWLTRTGFAVTGAFVLFLTTIAVVGDEGDEDDDLHVNMVVDGVAASDTATAEAVVAGERLERLRASLAAAQLREQGLEDRVDALEDDNERLAEEAAHPGIRRIVRAVAEDFGLTLGWIGLYFTLFLAWWNGRTPGKRLFGIRVVRLDGRPVTLWVAFERFGGYVAGVATGLLGFAQAFWDPNRQAIHDKIAQTVVVRTTRGDRGPAGTVRVSTDDATDRP